MAKGVKCKNCGGFTAIEIVMDYGLPCPRCGGRSWVDVDCVNEKLTAMTMPPAQIAAIEVAALCIEAQALSIECDGMKVANKCRDLEGFSPAYGEECFVYHAQDLRAIAKRLRELKGE